ncbi:MAG: hypothetical protein ACK5PF_09845, partial [bacterium]
SWVVLACWLFRWSLLKPAFLTAAANKENGQNFYFWLAKVRWTVLSTRPLPILISAIPRRGREPGF